MALDLRLEESQILRREVSREVEWERMMGEVGVGSDGVQQWDTLNR